MFDLLATLAVIAFVVWAIRRSGSRRSAPRDEVLERLARLEQQVRELQGAAELPRRETAEPDTHVAAAEAMPAPPAIPPASPVPPPVVAIPPPPPVPVPPPRAAEPPPRAPRPPARAPEPPLRLPPLPERDEPRRPTPPPRLPSLPAIDWESFVGVKLFSWVAAVALVFAAVFFLRYSIEHGWLGPRIRAAIGLLVGVGLLAACELRAARRYPVTANALDASGIAILFATLFAAHALWDLIGRVPAFALMGLVTAVAVGLSIRRDSLFIALLGLVGGFSTPALLASPDDQPISLFGYLLLLNAGLAWVGYRKQWPALTALSIGFTALYQWSWVVRFVDAARLPLALAIFAVFPLLHFFALAWGTGRRREGPLSPLFGRTAAAAGALPVLFALYSVAIPEYGERYVLLFGFLFLVAGALTVIAASRGPRLLHVLGGGAVLLAVALWLARSYSSFAWPGILGCLAGFVLFYAAAPFVAARLGRPLGDEAAPGKFVAPLLLFAFPILAQVEPAAAEPAVLFIALFALLAVIAAAALAHDDGRIHHLAALFALSAEAVWSANHLTPARLLPALLLYGGFGLFQLAVPIAAERLGKKLEPAAAGAAVLLASLALLFFLAAGPVAQHALWGIGILAALLNAGLFRAAIRGPWPMAALVGAVLSWLVIGVWWTTALVAATLLPALMIIAGFALLVLLGNLWAEREAGGRDATAFHLGRFAAIAAHAFLMTVAADASLSIPPWPLFGILFVLDLAIGAAALYQRKADLHLGALVASQLVVAVWVATARVAPWPLLGLSAGTWLAGYGVLWMQLARRRGVGGPGFAVAAVPALFLGQAIAIVAAGQEGAPALPWLVGHHVILLVAILAIALEIERHWLTPLAVLPTAFATAAWADAHAAEWQGALLFAGAIYAVFFANPLVLARRAPKAREPYLAAVLASASFFLVARKALVAAGFGDVIGILPVAPAGLLAILVRRRLTHEAPAERAVGRLALVAAAALAFVTIAIPLQLDREWITIGWALEAAALAWLYAKVPHRGLLAWSAGLGVVVFARLCFNPAVFEYHPRSAVPIWNWYLYTYLVPAAAFFGAARRLRATDDAVPPRLGGFRVSDGFLAAGAILLFLLLNIEIADFYSAGEALTFDFSADLAQNLTYTIGWALFGIGLLAAGIVGKSRAPRVAALGLLSVTMVKCFLHDLWRLGGLYRVGSFVGLAISLALVALLLQKFVLGAQKEQV